MLPSEFAEVQSYADLKRLLTEHVDMQFVDVRTVLRLPAPGFPGGCNFVAAAVMFNIIAGSSVCFYRASEPGLKARAERGDRFKGLLRDFYPWQGEPVSDAAGADLLYGTARNPLAHSLGLDEPPTPGKARREIALRKRSLTEAEIAELEDSIARPAWVVSRLVWKRKWRILPVGS